MRAHRDQESFAHEMSDEPRFPPASTPARLRPEARRVLIVEDERRLRDMLLISVREMGWEPTGAASAEGALKLLDQSPFAIAVVDLNLPGIDGLDFCERVRQQSRAMQFVVLTGFGNLDFARRAIRVDASDFLIKPCRMDELESAIERAHGRWIERSEGQPPATFGPSVPAMPTTAPVTTDAPSSTPAASAVAPAEPIESLDEMERRLIHAALARHAGCREAAAADLGISVRKLYYRLQQYQK